MVNFFVLYVPQPVMLYGTKTSAAIF